MSRLVTFAFAVRFSVHHLHLELKKGISDRQRISITEIGYFGHFASLRGLQPKEECDTLKTVSTF